MGGGFVTALTIKSQMMGSPEPPAGRAGTLALTPATRGTHAAPRALAESRRWPKRARLARAERILPHNASTGSQACATTQANMYNGYPNSRALRRILRSDFVAPTIYFDNGAAHTQRAP